MKFFKNKKWLWISIVLIGIILALFFLTRKETGSKQTFHEARVERATFTSTILATGSVAPENRLAIKPPVAGRVEKILVQEGNRVQKGQVLAWISTTERAALLDSARAEGEAELAQWEQYYKATPVYAPIAGMIILRSLEPGQSFSAGDSILVMSDRLTIKAQVDETNIAKITLGQKAKVILDAYPNEKLDATVVHRGFDSRTINSVTSYIVDVLPTQVPSHMLSGMTANVEFFLQDLPDSLLIPSEAVQTNQGDACIRIKSNQNSTTPCTPVKLGPSNDKKTVVLSGVPEGEIILVPDLKSIEPRNTSPSKNPFSPMGGGRGRH